MAKILVVDDDPEIRDVVREVLELDGHQIATFDDGERALAHVNRHPVELLITDIFMPEVDGLQIIREIRRRRLKMPIVAMSGVDFGGQDYLGVAEKFGAFATLKKPFSPGVLRDLVAALLAPAASAR